MRLAAERITGEGAESIRSRRSTDGAAVRQALREVEQERCSRRRAICEAVGRPNMRFVPAKSVEQQDMQALHRIRSRLIGNRTQLSNQVRGLLAEYGIVLPQRLSQLRKIRRSARTLLSRSRRGTLRVRDLARLGKVFPLSSVCAVSGRLLSLATPAPDLPCRTLF